MEKGWRRGGEEMEKRWGRDGKEMEKKIEEIERK